MTIRRIKLKVGIVEVEVEGEQHDLGKVALNLLTRAIELPAVSTFSNSDNDYSDINQENPDISCFISRAEIPSIAGRKQSMASLAKFRGCETGEHLVRLACEHLHFVKSKYVVSRKEILSEMKKAKPVYKSSLQNNISTQYLKPFLEDGFLKKREKGDYSLTNQAIKTVHVHF